MTGFFVAGVVVARPAVGPPPLNVKKIIVVELWYDRKYDYLGGRVYFTPHIVSASLKETGKEVEP